MRFRLQEIAGGGGVTGGGRPRRLSCAVRVSQVPRSKRSSLGAAGSDVAQPPPSTLQL